MKRKTILLFLALAMPVLVFLFLKFFGKNEFAVPVYFAGTMDSVNSVCGTSYAAPYQVADSVLQRAQWHGSPASVYLFRASAADPELMRVSESFGNELQIISIDSISLDTPERERWRSCVFIVPDTRNAVLVDKQKRIRGYYSLGSREEADRLMLELEIMLKKY